MLFLINSGTFLIPIFSIISKVVIDIFTCISGNLLQSKSIYFIPINSHIPSLFNTSFINNSAISISKLYPSFSSNIFNPFSSFIIVITFILLNNDVSFISKWNYFSAPHPDTVISSNYKLLVNLFYATL